MKKYYNSKTKNEKTKSVAVVCRDSEHDADAFKVKTLNSKSELTLSDFEECCKDKGFAKKFNKGIPITELLDIVNLEKAHICKYCGSVVEGTEEDLLCDDCREVFGHTFFSEL